MASQPEPRFRWFLEEGTAVIEVLCRELNVPEFALELRAQLLALLGAKPAEQYVVNFHKTDYMSSTGFAALLDFVKAATAGGARVAICGMQKPLRVGADILQIDKFVPIVDDEATAKAAVQAPPSS